MTREGEDETFALDAPMSANRIDSLISIEARNWTRRSVGIEISMLEIMQAEISRVLGETTQKRPLERFKART